MKRREDGISQANYFNCRKKYAGGLSASKCLNLKKFIRRAFGSDAGGCMYCCGGKAGWTINSWPSNCNYRLDAQTKNAVREAIAGSKVKDPQPID